MRGEIAYGFFLEYDRGTECARKYAAKFGAYYRYRESGQAARDYNGFPTLLFVTTTVAAEQRIAEEAYRAWFVRGTEPLPVLVTTTSRIRQHRLGILGPIWRSPAAARDQVAERAYWLPEAPPGGLLRVGGPHVCSPRLVWPTARDTQLANGHAVLGANGEIASPADSRRLT